MKNKTKKRLINIFNVGALSALFGLCFFKGVTFDNGLNTSMINVKADDETTQYQQYSSDSYFLGNITYDFNNYDINNYLECDYYMTLQMWYDSYNGNDFFIKRCDYRLETIYRRYALGRYGFLNYDIHKTINYDTIFQDKEYYGLITEYASYERYTEMAARMDEYFKMDNYVLNQRFSFELNSSTDNVLFETTIYIPIDIGEYGLYLPIFDDVQMNDTVYYANTEHLFTENGSLYGNQGYSQGYGQGLSDGYNNGYGDGYNAGYAVGQDEDAVVSSIFNSVLGVGLMPVEFFLKMLNFEILGINISGIITGLFTFLIAMYLAKLAFGGDSKGGGK